MLLLHLMAQIFPQKIRAIYIDHQLQDQSAEWAEVVATQATILNILILFKSSDCKRQSGSSSTSSTLSSISATFTRK